MKGKFLMMGLLLAAWAGCSDDSFKEYPSEENVDDNIPVPVQLSLGEASYSATTKGLTGAVDEQEEGNEVWQEAKVYVYAFLKRMEGNSFEATMSSDNVGGVSSVSAPCLIDGSSFSAKVRRNICCLSLIRSALHHRALEDIVQSLLLVSMLIWSECASCLYCNNLISSGIRR